MPNINTNSTFSVVGAAMLLMISSSNCCYDVGNNMPIIERQIERNSTVDPSIPNGRLYGTDTLSSTYFDGKESDNMLLKTSNRTISAKVLSVGRANDKLCDLQCYESPEREALNVTPRKEVKLKGRIKSIHRDTSKLI